MPNRLKVEFQDKVFAALYSEAFLCRSLAQAGITSLRGANHTEPGRYYEGFFALTISLERTCKLVLLLDRFITTSSFDGSVKPFGHDLDSLFAAVEKVNQSRGLGVDVVPSTDHERRTLAFLSDFARGDRYYNLDWLTGISKSGLPPIDAWYALVWETVPEKRRGLTVKEQADVAFNAAFDASGLVLVRGSTETGTPIASLAAGREHFLLGERVRVYGALLGIRYLRYLYRILVGIDHELHGTGSEFPEFHEFFYMWGNSDSFLRGRKTFG